ncbi:hypothetical protein [Marinobacter confluentis]|uniref:Uncharacterized protein n=1 Tax=Marinobacter confluentis TaxID=1697557 RepID=A0A4Z1BZ38_9GAMM|nr:hypothetical protein [Marinobacter confluentis]TGN39958.1 hypothetical protein E5Q11_06585 [Marinobacter confluentis]
MSGVKQPSCKPSRRFWLELAGEQSLDGHNYCLQNHEAEQPSFEPLEPCPVNRGRMGPILAGPADAPEERSLVLELHGDETVVVPLLERKVIAPEALLPPQRNYQNSLMVAVHPTLFCDVGELSYPRPLTGYRESIAAPLRTGWIYVFFRGQLWRELSVTTAEDSAPLMRDTNLGKCRQGPEKNRSQRLPVGPDADTLHIPAKLLGQDVYNDVELAFSDTQWSWQHIEALQSNSVLRASRCRNAGAVKGFLNRIPGTMFPDWHLVDELEPMRARDNPLERDIFMLNQWLRDVDGGETRKIQNEVVAQRDAIESGDSVVDADMGIYPQTILPRWRHQHLVGKALPEVRPGTDVFRGLRDRCLLTLTLRDPLFAARQLANHINQALILMFELVNNISARAHGNTAELFHNNFRRETLPDGSPNPLYIEGSWFDTRLDDSEDGLLLRTLYEVERKALRHFLVEAQGALVRLLDDTRRPENLTEVLRDLFNLEAGDDIAGYVQTGPLLAALSVTVGRMDPLVLPQQAGRMSAFGAEELNEALLLGAHPLTAQLLPLNALDDTLPGDATGAKLQKMVAALKDRKHELRTLEGNFLRSVSGHMAETGELVAEEHAHDTRFGAHAFSTPFSEISQWWLGGFQEQLEKQGAVLEFKASQVIGAFEGFVEAAIPGKTTLELQGEDGKKFVFLSVVDDAGNTLTSGAAMATALKLAEVEGFEAAAKQRPVQSWLYGRVVSPMGVPGLLVMLDLWNLWSAFRYSGETYRYGVGLASAGLDLAVSTGFFVSSLPNRSEGLDNLVGRLSKNAQWFSELSNGINSSAEEAEDVVRSKLGAAGWIAGNMTAAIFTWDAIAHGLDGRMKLAGTDLTKAAGLGVMANSDIIAGRYLTPTGKKFLQRSGVQALVQAIDSRLAGSGFASKWVRGTLAWGGRVTAGWVTLLGFCLYGTGEWLYSKVKDDEVSKWLRAGPFSGDLDEQNEELKKDDAAYLGLIRAMMPISLIRITGNELSAALQKTGMQMWEGNAESLFVFSTPAFTVTGEPLNMEWTLAYERSLDRPSRDPGGRVRVAHETGNITLTHDRKQSESAIQKGLIQPIDHSFDGEQTACFVISESQFRTPMLPAEGSLESVYTRYWIKSLKLTYEVSVWNRTKKEAKPREITQEFTNLEIEIDNVLNRSAYRPS